MIIELINVNKSIEISDGVKKTILENFNHKFDLNNKVSSLVAPVKSGKSTFLRLIAGLANCDSGEIKMYSEIKKSEKPKIIFMPSIPVSLPWLSVEKNLKFGLGNSLDEEELKRILKIIGLEAYRAHIPNKDSKGFRFRISFGRALLTNPDLILIDESFNELGMVTREEILKMIKNAVTSVSTKVLFTTSNIIDALFISDQIYLATGCPINIIEQISLESNFESYSEILSSDIIKNLLLNISDKKIILNGIIT